MCIDHHSIVWGQCYFFIVFTYLNMILMLYTIHLMVNVNFIHLYNLHACSLFPFPLLNKK